MAFYDTTTADARRGKADLPPKNRVGGFLATPPYRARRFAPQPLAAHRENAPTPTKPASGLSCWLARDPIGEPDFEMTSQRTRSPKDNIVHDLRLILAEVQPQTPEIVQSLKNLLLDVGIDLYSLQTQRNIYTFIENDVVDRTDLFGLHAKGPTTPPAKNSDQCCDKEKEAAKKLLDEVIDGLLGEAKKLPGKAGQIAKILELLKKVKDTKNNCSGMTDVANTCVDFAKDPTHVGCMACCLGIYTSFPLIGGVGYFTCHNICRVFD